MCVCVISYYKLSQKVSLLSSFSFLSLSCPSSLFHSSSTSFAPLPPFVSLLFSSLTTFSYGLGAAVLPSPSTTPFTHAHMIMHAGQTKQKKTEDMLFLSLSASYHALEVNHLHPPVYKKNTTKKKKQASTK